MTLQGARVFVVEDDGLICMLIEDLLLTLGCEVVATAADLDDALQKALTIQADLGVLDINLAGEMSYPVAHALAARNIPFLFASGYGKAGLPPDLCDAPVLAKPFKLEQLASALHRARAAGPQVKGASISK